jgi:alkylation response protein AidB-like acyl-CoA dehydrogenase
MTNSLPAAKGPSFGSSLDSFRERMGTALRGGGGEDPWNAQRGIAPAVFEELKATRALSLAVPAEYGGGAAGPKEILSLLEAASYESLSLGLTVGINIALFLQPLAKYGSETAKRRAFGRFVGEGALGGLMLTEPDYGTDLLSMRTSFERRGGTYAVEGVKHWAGLSGLADFWILSARERKEGGSLRRDIDFFLCDSSRPEERIVMEEAYPNLGLALIPYGRNRVDLRLPPDSRLEDRGSGVRLLLDLLHRSRMSFGGMASGFLRSVLDRALERCGERRVGGRLLLEYDQVERRLAEIQAAVTLSSAFCARAAGAIGLERDLSGEGLEANIHKAVLSDLMQQASQSFLQLSGAQGYRLDSPAGRATVDSRPFQIFEGSNDVLYDQIASAFLASMKGGASLAASLAGHGLTRRAADRFARVLDFAPAAELAQRKRVDLGRILARVAAADLLVGLGDAGFEPRLVGGAQAFLGAEVAGLVAGYSAGHLGRPEPAPAGGSAAWQDFAP